MTYNGVALTKLTGSSDYSNSFGFLVMWYLVNPPTGANTVVVTWPHAGNNLGMAAVATDFYNVDQAAPFGDTATVTGGTSLSLTTGAGSMTVGATGGGGSAGTGQVYIAGVVSGNAAVSMSYEPCVVSDATFDFSYASSGIMVAAVLQGPQGVVVMSADYTVGTRGFAMTVHKSKLFALSNLRGAEEQYSIYSTADPGASTPVWATANGTGWPTAAYLQTSVTRANNWSQKYADIMGFGTNIIVAIYEDPDSSGGSVPQVRIGYSPDSGANWTFHADLVIACTDTPNISLISARDIFSTFGATVPALVTSDNIYLLDIANDGYQAMLPEGILGGSAHEALAVSHASDASIYISKASGDILRIMVPSPGVIDLRNVGPHSRSKGVESDGLVSARQGHANFMWGGDPRWLFVAYGGHASGKNGSIFCFDYVTGAWHSFYKDGTENREMIRIIGSDEDDGVSRLHMATDQAAASIMQQFEEPYVSAGTGVTQQFRSTGYVEWAEDDLGDPHADS
jgi:hypothetical protein